MWNIFALSKEAQLSPSEFLRIQDDYMAYCFDEVCIMWGSYVTAQVREAGEAKKSAKQKGLEAKQDRKFKALMDQPDEVRFASPVPTK